MAGSACGSCCAGGMIFGRWPSSVIVFVLSTLIAPRPAAASAICNLSASCCAAAIWGGRRRPCRRRTPAVAALGVPDSHSRTVLEAAAVAHCGARVMRRAVRCVGRSFFKSGGWLRRPCGLRFARTQGSGCLRALLRFASRSMQPIPQSSFHTRVLRAPICPYSKAGVYLPFRCCVRASVVLRVRPLCCVSLWLGSFGVLECVSRGRCVWGGFCFGRVRVVLCCVLRVSGSLLGKAFLGGSLRCWARFVAQRFARGARSLYRIFGRRSQKANNRCDIQCCLFRRSTYCCFEPYQTKRAPSAKEKKQGGGLMEGDGWLLFAAPKYHNGQQVSHTSQRRSAPRHSFLVILEVSFSSAHTHTHMKQRKNTK